MVSRPAHMHVLLASINGSPCGAAASFNLKQVEAEAVEATHDTHRVYKGL